MLNSKPKIKNLFNPALYRKAPYTFQGITVQGDGDEVIFKGTATTSVYNGFLSAPDVLTNLPEILRGKDVYISVYETGLYNDTLVTFGFYSDNNEAAFLNTRSTNGVVKVNISSDKTKWWIRASFTKGKTYDERFKIMISEEPHTEYVPYKE